MMLCDMPAPILVDIFLYLTPLEIIRLESYAKYFKKLIRSTSQVFQAHFNKIHSLFPYAQQLHWKRILKRLILNRKTFNAFLPYYTDGGIKEESPHYFIDKLINPTGMHSTILNENVLIKYAYKGKNNFQYAYPSNYRIEENVYFIPDIEALPLKDSKKIPFIEKIVICLPESEYCSLSFVAFFSSLDNTDPIDIVNRFKGCKSKHRAISKGINLELICTYQKSRFSTTVFYKKISASVRPLCWIKIKNDGIIKPSNLTVKLPQPIFAKYFYVLMISSGIQSPSACINVNYISPICKEIRVFA
ncbi:hypothetical protein SteCoe_15234 [Stentor coeruleus]|uniref:F-box domain-containing protein n=1 Tax=Stentor coeruleus TaxID=5963 RepID=A0A1R2C437_9CILI|nr:hypothetical protein SteCoe_15234 [Stentor coeruleus]